MLTLAKAQALGVNIPLERLAQLMPVHGWITPSEIERDKTHVKWHSLCNDPRTPAVGFANGATEIKYMQKTGTLFRTYMNLQKEKFNFTTCE